MLNVDLMSSQADRNKVVDKFVEKLELSGYNAKQIWDIITSGLKGYENKIET